MEVKTTPTFEKSLKRLAKKFRSVKNIFQKALDDLEKSQEIGEEIKGYQNYYKVRYPNVDANKGKRGGFRIIYYSPKGFEIVVLVDIYSKSDQQTIDWDTIKNNIEEIEDGRT